jgi:hypothetical protein
VAVGRARRISLGVVLALVLLLGLAQLLLPRIAGSTISSRIGRYGHVQSVSVSAWPAIELLWGNADSVTVRAGELSLSPQQAAKLVWEGRGVERIDMSAAEVRLGRLRVSAVSLRKRASALSAQASVSAADVSAALPAGMSLALLGSEAGSVEVKASGGLFGVSASLDAVARPENGKLIARPLGLPFSVLQLSLFSDPHVYVEGVGASSSAGAEPGYRLQLSARLR